MGAAKLAAASACALLAACGGGGGGGSGAASGTPGSASSGAIYLPLDASNKWLYSAAPTGAGTPASLKLLAVAGMQPVGSVNASVLVSSQPGAGGSSSTELYAQQGNGLWEYPNSSSDPITTQIGPIQLIQYPVSVGATFVQVDKTVDSGVDYDGDGKTDPLTVNSNVTVDSASETVTTPAGTFANCLHTTTILKESLIANDGTVEASATLTEDDWYAPNIGLVQEKLSGTSVAPSTEQLVEYRLAGKSSAAPLVASETPTSNVARGATLSVSATFTEPVDAATLNAGGLTIVDASNAVVAGTVQVDTNTSTIATFTPAQPWATGRYTATVTSSARNLVGNPVSATRAWSLNVDATSPGLVSSTPAQGAQGVALGTTVTLVFSEPLAPATIVPSNFTLLDQASNVLAGSVALAGDGVTVTFTPAAALTRRMSYTLNLSGNITDLVGNPLAGIAGIGFRSDQGRFAEPVPIAISSTLSPVSCLAADLDGDGINDMVCTVSGVPGTSAAVMYGQSDGTLGAPVLLTDGSTRQYGEVAVGDVNGDGLPDIVVGSNYTGMQVYLQNPGGGFAAGDYLNRAYAAPLRIADIDGDGKNELLALDSGGGVDIWHQNSTGHLVFQQTLQAAQQVFGFEIGDVNGDGLPDIVVTGSTTLGPVVAVLLSQGGGTFAAPTLLAAGPTWFPLGGPAIGDVNGDGRKDIIISGGGNLGGISVYYQQSNGTLAPAVGLPSYDIPDGVRAVDINGDGRADILVAHDGWAAMGVYLQQADGTLAAESLYDAPYAAAGSDGFYVGDVNRDGLPDVMYGGSLILQKPVAPFSAAAMRPPAAAYAHALVPSPRRSPTTALRESR
jgi:hypothetical protein